MKVTLIRCLLGCLPFLPGLLVGATAENEHNGKTYAVIDISGGPEATSYPVHYQSTAPDFDDASADVYMEDRILLRRIPAGTFLMGTPESEEGRNALREGIPGEPPTQKAFQHTVTLSKDYYIGVFEITQEQYFNVMGLRPSKFPGKHHPVDCLSYEMIRGTAEDGHSWPFDGHQVSPESFLGRLSRKTGLTIDLPTEAQWEYACRAGTASELYNGKTISNHHTAPELFELARWKENGVALGQQHARVGSYKPNPWGLYDMYGNVWEWCLDWFTLGYPDNDETDPVGCPRSDVRSMRGGGWYSYPYYCRSGGRFRGEPSLVFHDQGFRICIQPDIPIHVSQEKIQRNEARLKLAELIPSKQAKVKKPGKHKTARHFDICDFGAIDDGTTVSTNAIQAAIDACADSGGGTVFIPAGRFVSGTIRIKSHVQISFAKGAVLLGSPNLADYPLVEAPYLTYANNTTVRSLFLAIDAEDIMISGPGLVDGQGKFFVGNPHKQRPCILRIIGCKKVTVEGLSLTNSPKWVQHYFRCEDLFISGLSVSSHSNWNNDAVDIDGCSNVIVENCSFDSRDDALCFKSTSKVPCEYITVNNCVLKSHNAAIKMGTESIGGFKNIAIQNCVVRESGTGINLASVDGAIMENIQISNISGSEVAVPIMIRLGNRGRGEAANNRVNNELGKWANPEGSDPVPVGSVRNIMISQVQISGSLPEGGCFISGIPGYPIENVTLSNIRLANKGGGTVEQALRKIPEMEDGYPFPSMFGVLPSSGLFIRHVKGLRILNSDFTCSGSDERPSFVLEDVQNVQLSRLLLNHPESSQPTMRFENTRNVLIDMPVNAPNFLELKGDNNSGIVYSIFQ